VKIIKQGKLPNEEVFQGDCTHCGTVVEFERKEATCSVGMGGVFLTVICPLCGRKIHDWEAI
jgi:endogenous inhibitor of DNA gyrase (YacG/DUF329 family)